MAPNKKSKFVKSPSAKFRKGTLLDNKGEVVSDSTGKYIRKECIEPTLSSFESYLLGKKTRKCIIDRLQRKVRMHDKTKQDLSKLISDHFAHDLFAAYYNDINKLKVDTTKNPLKMSLVNKLHKPRYNVITEDNYLGSFVFGMRTLELLTKTLLQKDPSYLEILANALEGTPLSEMDKKKLGELMALISSNAFNSSLGDQLKDAEEDLKNLANGPSSEGYDNSHKDLQQIDAHYNVIEKIKAINLSGSQVSNFLKSVLEKSKNYFSRKYKKTEIPLIESLDLEGFEEIIEITHPELFRMCINDLSLDGSIPIGTINMYLDCSGSMGSDNEAESLIIMAKATAINLMKKGFIDTVYLFSDRVSEKALRKPIEVLEHSIGGGTDFNNVFEHTTSLGRNAIVITDGECHISHYSKDIYWIWVEKANMSYFTQHPAGKKYIENDQCVYFDGKTLQKITVKDLTSY